MASDLTTVKQLPLIDRYRRRRRAVRRKRRWLDVELDSCLLLHQWTFLSLHVLQNLVLEFFYFKISFSNVCGKVFLFSACFVADSNNIKMFWFETLLLCISVSLVSLVTVWWPDDDWSSWSHWSSQNLRHDFWQAVLGQSSISSHTSHQVSRCRVGTVARKISRGGFAVLRGGLT